MTEKTLLGVEIKNMQMKIKEFKPCSYSSLAFNETRLGVGVERSVLPRSSKLWFERVEGAHDFPSVDPFVEEKSNLNERWMEIRRLIKRWEEPIVVFVRN